MIIKSHTVNALFEQMTFASVAMKSKQNWMSYTSECIFEQTSVSKRTTLVETSKHTAWKFDKIQSLLSYPHQCMVTAITSLFVSKQSKKKTLQVKILVKSEYKNKYEM